MIGFNFAYQSNNVLLDISNVTSIDTKTIRTVKDVPHFNIQTSDYDVIEIENLTTNGWTWRYSDDLNTLTNINISEPRIVAITRRPNNDFLIDVIVVTYSTYQEGLTTYVNYTFLYFTLNYSNPDINKEEVIPKAQFVDGFSIVEDANDAPRITKIAIAWIGLNNLTLVYALEERRYNSTYDFRI